ncbi:J domain-containing protein [Aspergillus foveolatus]|uniref:J domain-containing protein n=1 Tax=Aspergillus foveolatus TaxID=210207 RepID=UPI003CCD3D1A
MNNNSEQIPRNDADADNNEAETYSLLMSYPEELDYYAVLGLPRDPPPTDGAIRSAYRTLTLSFHPDKQPPELQDAAKQQFERIREAYDTLIDPKKRVVYDLLGAEGVRREWGIHGAMGRGGEAERQEKQGQVGVKTMKPDEFRRWFLESMKNRERAVLNSLVRSKGSLIVGVDARDMISVNEREGEVYLEIPSAKLSSFAVRYSFVTPFPTLRAVMGEDEREDAESEVEEKEEQKASQSPELEIYAGVAGGFQRLFNKVELEWEDGETELREVPLPLILSTQNVTLGASTSRVLSDPNPKGILKRWPFSLFQDTLVSVEATALPSTTVQANVAKSIVVTPGTRPFNVILGTFFNRSIFQAPPMLNLQVTKGIGQKKTAFCSWSSGFIGWPTFIETLLLPFAGDGLSLEDQAISQLQVGIASQLSKLAPGLAEEDEDMPGSAEDDEEEDEFEMLRAKKREEQKAAEAWHIAISASPATAGFIFKYSRNIFSGKPATDAALSQWSSEKHYSLPPANEPRSVRLEITSTVDMNLSLRWSVHGSRQVSELTRVGFGVSLQPQGLIMSLSWARLGQRIRLPIAICPIDSVNADSATLAVVLPWLTYCAVEFGFIRPRERRNRRRLIAKRQKKLRKLVPQKRLESTQAIELMADQVRRRQDKEYSRGGLVITKAEYGHYPSKRNADQGAKEPGVTDVTIPVAALVDHGQLIISKKTAKFQILGFHDPAPLLPKTLKIWYQYHGKDHYAEATDAEGVTCPMRSHLLAA